MKFSVLMLMQILVIVKVYGDDCVRPQEVLKFEEDCFQEHSGFIEKVQQKATSLFESAKKRLGIGNEDDATSDQKPKKCEYYQCVLKKMQVTNEHGIPDLGLVQNKYEKEMPDEKEARPCFAISANIEKMMHSDEDTVAGINAETSRVTIKQARDTMNEILCEINSQVVRCLSQIPNKDNKCPLFVFP